MPDLSDVSVLCPCGHRYFAPRTVTSYTCPQCGHVWNNLGYDTPGGLGKWQTYDQQMAMVRKYEQALKGSNINRGWQKKKDRNQKGRR